MVITGVYLSRYFDTKVGQDYTGYLDATKKNRLFRDAFLRIVENRYKTIPFQNSRDEDGFVITTGAQYTVLNNRIYTAPLQITNIVFGTPTIITTYLPHNMAVGTTSITISEVDPVDPLVPLNPTLNATFVATRISATTFSIPYVNVSGVYLAPSGQFTYTNMVSDYWHVLNMKCKFEQQLYPLTITGATNAIPIVLTLSTYSQLLDYDQITVSGVTGNTNANGTYYIKKLNDFKVALYTDEFLQTPRAGNAAYVSGGIIKKVYFKEAKPYLPKTKISSLNTPTVLFPRFENAQRLFKIYPTNVTCSLIEIDYLRQPDVAIDVADDIVDLTNYYPQKFLFHLTDVAGQMFAIPTRDEELYKLIQNEIPQ